MSITRAVWMFLALLTSIRLALLGTAELSFDEAHYWMWSERLAPAYFSKGPLVAFAIRASTAIFGDTEFGVRFWSPLLGAGTSLLLFYFARRLFNAAVGFWTVLAMNVTPILNIGSFVMTIDPLSIFFWTAAMFTFWLALERTPNFSWYWPVTGFLIGLGFLSKYTNGLQLVSVALVLLLVPRLRREFARPNLYCLLAAFVLCAIPPLIWNAQHAWTTFVHLRTRGGFDQSFGFHPQELLLFLAQHFVTYSPLLFLGLAWAVVASWPRVHKQFKLLYLVWFGLPLFAIYFLLSFNNAANPNWDALSFLSLGPLAVAYWLDRIQARPALERWAGAALVIGLCMSFVTLGSDALRSVGIKMPWRDPSQRMRGWKSAAGAVEKVRFDLETQLGERIFLIADERDRASEFAFYLREKRAEGPGHPPVYIVESQDLVNQFSFWPRYDEFVEAPPNAPRPEGDIYTEEGGVNLFAGRTALYIAADPGSLPARNIVRGFQSIEHYATIQVRRFGEVIRTLELFVCRGYRTLPL